MCLILQVSKCAHSSSETNALPQPLQTKPNQNLSLQ